MPPRNSSPSSPSGVWVPTAVLAGLALLTAGTLLWTLREARSRPALAAASPVAPGLASVAPTPARAAFVPLLSSLVALNQEQAERAPIQLSSVGTSIAQARPTLPTQPAERRALCIQALAQLRDDDIPRNAMQAMRQLRALDCATDPNLRPLLVACLKSQDLQQRSLIASYLYARSQAPEEELLLAAAMDIGDDIVPRPHKSIYFQGYPEDWTRDDRLGLPPTLHNARQAAQLLLHEGQRAWPHLLKRLHASDPQERFLSAVLLARTGCSKKTKLTVTILVTHLKHNDWKGDATIACRALYGLADQALPHLRALGGITDPQAHKLLRLVIKEIEDPSPNASQAYERALRMAPGRDGKPLVVWRYTPDMLDGLVRH